MGEVGGEWALGEGGAKHFIPRIALAFFTIYALSTAHALCIWSPFTEFLCGRVTLTVKKIVFF